MRRRFLPRLPSLRRIRDSFLSRPKKVCKLLRQELATFEVEELEERTLLSGSAPTQEAEPNDTIATATAIGALSGVDLSLAGAISAGNDVDLFSVELQAGTQLSAQVSTQGLSSSLDTYLRLFDAAGTQIAFDDDSGSGTNSLLTRAISTTGTYYLGVTAYGNSSYNPLTGTGGTGSSTGTYTLIVGTLQSDGNDTIGTAVALGSLTEAGTTRLGAIDTTSDIDLYSVMLQSGVVFSVQSNFSGALRIFNSSGVQIASGSSSSLSYATTSAGIYYAGISSAGNTSYNPITGVGGSGSNIGSYVVTFGVEQSDGNDTIATAVALGSLTEAGATRAGAISTTSDFDLYSVELQANSQLSAQVSTQGLSSSLDTYLRVFNSAGSQIAFDDDSGTGLDSALSKFIGTAGTYYLGVSSSGNSNYNPVAGTGGTGGTGAYSLIVSASPTDGNDTLTTSTSLGAVTSAGVTRSGTIDSTKDVDLYYVDVELSAGDVISVRASTQGLGSSLDGYLRLFDPNGAQIASNDNSNGSDPGLSLRVVSQGRYYIGVSSTGNSSYSPNTADSGTGSTTGAYSLTVAVTYSDRNDTLETALTLGTITNSSVTRSGKIEPNNDVDLYSLELVAGARLTVDASTQGLGSSLNGYLRVFNSSGVQIAANDNLVGNDPGLSVVIGTKGTYYVGVSASGNNSYSAISAGTASGATTGAYVLHVATENNDIFANATVVGVVPASGTSIAASIANSLDLDVYRLDLSTGQFFTAVIVTPQSSTLDTQLVLYDVAGRQVAYGNNPQPNQRDAGLAYDVLASGIYYLTVDKTSDSTLTASAAYTLNLQTQPQGYAGAIIRAGESVQYDVYLPQSGRIDLLIAQGAASGLVPEVSLSTVDGRLISTSHADASIPFEASLSQFLLPGTYRVFVQGALNSTGTFQLSTRFTAATSPTANLQLGQYSRDIIAADFNLDGLDDLVVEDWPYDRVSILISRGDGLFAERQTVDIPTGTKPLVVADFNADGRPDIAIASDQSRISVLLGNGDGTFVMRGSFDAGAGELQTADFNGDGRLDVAVINSRTVELGSPQSSGGISILLGQGDGSFAEQRTFTVGITPSTFTIGDVNGDGRLDIAVANQPSQFSAGGTSILFGRGDGAFDLSPTFAVGSYPTSIAIEDFNRDGRNDLAVLGRGVVSVALGRGDGSFDSPATLTVRADGASLIVEDFDGDGFNDIAVLDSPYFSAGNILIFLGRGDGSFAPRQDFAVGIRAVSMVTSDFNGDGRLDIAVADRDEDGVSILLSRQSGLFSEQIQFAAGESPRALRIGDFNGDGRLDIATLNDLYTRPDDISVFLGNGDGTFAGSQPKLAGNNPQTPTQADVNSDGRLDLIVPNRTDDTVSVLLGRGDGSFAPEQTYSVGDNPISVTLGDFNRDGRLDMAVVNAPNSGNGSASILLGRGDGTFAPRQDFIVGNRPSILLLDDLNGDGRSDLVVINSDGFASVLLGRDDGTFAPRQVTALGSSPRTPTLTDFNGDGRPDLAVAFGSYGSAAAAVLLGRGDGTFAAPQTFGGGGNGANLTVADFNGDGKPDLAVTRDDLGSESGGLETGYSLYDYYYPPIDNLVVFLGRGDGTFTEQSQDLGGAAQSVTATDMNGDGRLDLVLWDVENLTVAVVPAQFVGWVTVLLGQGNGTFVQQSPSLEIGRSITFNITDVNVDGLPDYVVTKAGYYSANSIAVYLARGDGTFIAQPESLIDYDPRTPIVGDFNADNRPDLVVANSGASGVSVMLGTGDGAFTSQNAFQNSLRDPVHFADLNGDGLLDSATVDARGRILVRLGRTSTAIDFGSPLIINQGVFDAETLPAARDLVIISGASGAARLAVLNKTATSGPNGLADNVAVYQLDRQGQSDSFIQLTLPTSFTNGDYSSTGSLAGRLTTADLNGDGRDDLVVTNPGLGTVAVLLAELDGGFDDAHWASYEVGSGPLTVTASHVNGDAFLDLVVANQVSGDVSVLTNDTQGRFTDQRRYDTSSALAGFGTDPLALRAAKQANLRTEDVVIADFDGDGEADLLVANSGAQSVSLLLGLGDGRFESPRETNVGGPVTSLAVGDFNRDGKADAALLNAEQDRLLIYTAGQNGSLQPLRVAGTGGTLQSVEMPAGNQPTSVQTIDLTGPSGRPDGVLDLVVGNEFGDVLVFQGNGDGTFQSFVRSDRTVTLAVLDLNGDGKQDVVTASAALDQVSVGFNQGGTQVTTDSLYQRDNGILAPGAIQLQDVTGDGVADLIVANGGGNQVLVFAGLGGGAFGSVQPYFTGTNPVGVTITDLDGVDGLDLIVANYGSNDVSILLNSGETSGVWQGFANGPRLDVGQAPVSTTLQDVTGDGVADLVVTNSQGMNSDGTIGNVEVLPGRGGGFFSDQTGDTSFIALPGQTGVQGAVFASPGAGELGAFGYVSLADGRVARFDLGNLNAPSEVLSNFSEVRWIAPFQMGSSLGIAAATRQNVELLVSADGEVFRSLRAFSGGLDPSAMILEQLSSDTLRIYVTEHGEDIVTVLDAQLNENLTSDQSTALAALRAQLAQNPIVVSQVGEPGAFATASLLLRGGIAAVFQLSPTTFAILRVNAPPGQLLERWTAEVRERLAPLLDTLVKTSVSASDGATRVLDGVLRIIPVQDRAALTNVVQRAWQILRPVVPNAGQLWEAGRVWIESFTNEPAADGAEQPMPSEAQPANSQTRVLEPANHDVNFPLEAGPWRLHALAEQLWNTMRAQATEETRHPITTLATALPHTHVEKNAPTGESEITDGEQWGPPEENLFDGEQFSNVGSLGRRGWTALATIAAAVGYSARSRNIRDKKEDPIAQS